MSLGQQQRVDISSLGQPGPGQLDPLGTANTIAPARARIRIISDQLKSDRWIAQAPAGKEGLLFEHNYIGTSETSDPSDALEVTVLRQGPEGDVLLQLDNGKYLGLRLFYDGMSNFERTGQSDCSRPTLPLGPFDKILDNFAAIVAMERLGILSVQMSTGWKGMSRAYGWQVAPDMTLEFNWALPDGPKIFGTSLSTNQQGRVGTVFLQYCPNPPEYFKKFPGWHPARFALDILPSPKNLTFEV